MRSVTRRKIWEGRCELGIEEHRTSGKREYVVGRQLRAFTTQVFRRRQISERFLSHVRIIHISIQVLIQTWTKNIVGTKKMNSCLAGYFERLCAKAWHTAINQTRRAQSGLARFDALSRKYRQHCNYSCKVLFAELYMPFSNQSKKTECVSISVSLVWQLGTVSELQHREDGLSNHDFAAFRFIFRSMRAVQILRALRKSDNDLCAW